MLLIPRILWKNFERSCVEGVFSRFNSWKIEISLLSFLQYDTSAEYKLCGDNV